MATTRLVLVVDDNAGVVSALVDAIKTEPGFDAIGTTRGVEAIRLLGERAPRVVLFDLAMPGMDGAELAQWLRSDPAARGVRLIGMTGLPGFAGMRRDAAGAGVTLILDKPLDVDELLEVLRRATGG